MSIYHNRQPSVPLMESGSIEFAADTSGARLLLRDAIRNVAGSAAPDELPLEMAYDNHRLLLELLSALQSKLSRADSERIVCRIVYDSEPAGAEAIPAADPAASPEGWNGQAAAGWFRLSELFGEVGGRSVADYILHHLFTTYLQPIVLPGGKTMGYEFLLRPLPELMPFRPAVLFEEARKIGMHSFLDRAARHSAIRMSASHLQDGVKRFINFLPSSLHCPTSCIRETFAMMRETGTSPEDYVFEVMETEPLDTPELQRVFDIYRQEGVLLALDDVGSGAGYTDLSVVDRLQPDYVKMDRRWVNGCDRDPAKQRYIEALLDRAARFNGIVLAEGVERKEEWEYLRRAGVPLFQGFLFGRAAPVPLPVAALAGTAAYGSASASVKTASPPRNARPETGNWSKPDGGKDAGRNPDFRWNPAVGRQDAFDRYDGDNTRG